MSKIDQILLNKSDSIYRVYVFKIRIDNKFKYVVGSCTTITIDELQRLLLVMHKKLKYLPQAKVLVADKVASDSLIVFNMQEEELLQRSRSFFSKEFNDVYELYSVDESKLLELYYSYIPDVRGLVLHEMMPRWSLLDSELDDIRKTSIEVSEDYRLTKG